MSIKNYFGGATIHNLVVNGNIIKNNCPEYNGTEHHGPEYNGTEHYSDERGAATADGYTDEQVAQARQHDLGRGRPRYKSLRQLVAEGLDADEVAERLRPLIQGQKGKRVALVMTCACEAGLLIEPPTFNALTDEFDDLGSKAGYNKQMTMSMNFTTTEKAPILALLKSVSADAS